MDPPQLGGRRPEASVYPNVRAAPTGRQAHLGAPSLGLLQKAQKADGMLSVFTCEFSMM